MGGPFFLSSARLLLGVGGNSVEGRMEDGGGWEMRQWSGEAGSASVGLIHDLDFAAVEAVVDATHRYKEIFYEGD